MAVNILIGIGGTGTKVVESALHLMAAGIGPADRVLIGLVDQDNGNGNLSRTLELLENIRAVRRHFTEPRQNLLDWQAAPADGGTRLFGVEVAPLMADGAHWRPADDQVTSLADILERDRMTDGERALFDLLFRGAGADQRDAEQTMPLSEGYRGRAHVGSAALLSAFHFDEPAFRDRLKELMRQSAQGQEVRIFLAGSLFGGTGAAGFPTIARTLHAIREAGETEEVHPERLHLGGVLMLPYFSFRDPEDREANVVRSGQLLPQARVALAFYDNLFRETRLFDRLHVIGWDRMFELGYHVPGRNEQRNPPLLPELPAALSALDFFLAPAIVAEEAMLTSARAGQGGFGWNDLPIDPANRDMATHRLAQALRFHCWWRYRVEPAFDNRGGFLGRGAVEAGRIKLPWLKRLAAGTDWQTGTPEARADLNALIDRQLAWAGAMQLFAEPLLPQFALWDIGSLLARADRDRPTEPVALHPERSEEQTLSDLAVLVRDRDAQSPARTARQLYDEISDEKRPMPAGQGTAGLGRIVWAVHRAARPTEREA